MVTRHGVNEREIGLSAGVSRLKPTFWIMKDSPAKVPVSFSEPTVKIKFNAQLAKCSTPCHELCKNLVLNLLGQNQKSDTVFQCPVSSRSSV